MNLSEEQVEIWRKEKEREHILNLGRSAVWNRSPVILRKESGIPYRGPYPQYLQGAMDRLDRMPTLRDYFYFEYRVIGGVSLLLHRVRGLPDGGFERERIETAVRLEYRA